jgi:hypothetical protein
VPLTTKIVSSNSAHGDVYSIQHYVITLLSDLRQVGSFHHDWTQILLKVALNTTSNTTSISMCLCNQSNKWSNQKNTIVRCCLINSDERNNKVLNGVWHWHIYNLKQEWSGCTPEGWVFPNPLVAPEVLLMFKIRWYKTPNSNGNQGRLLYLICHTSWF